MTLNLPNQIYVVIAILAIVVIAGVVLYSVAKGRNVKVEVPGGAKLDINAPGPPASSPVTKSPTQVDQSEPGKRTEPGGLGGDITNTHVLDHGQIEGPVEVHIGHSFVQKDDKQIASRKKESA